MWIATFTSKFEQKKGMSVWNPFWTKLDFQTDQIIFQELSGGRNNGLLLPVLWYLPIFNVADEPTGDLDRESADEILDL